MSDANLPAARALARCAISGAWPFTLRRVLALFVTILVGVYLTIIIANMGGKVDELRELQIRSTVAEAVRADPSFQTMSSETQ